MSLCVLRTYSELHGMKQGPSKGAMPDIENYGADDRCD